MLRMARACTTLDAFNAVAEPKRRRVLDVLAGRERPVNDMVELLGWPQPMISETSGGFEAGGAGIDGGKRGGNGFIG